MRANRRDWPLPNGDYDNTRASAETIIDSSNIERLTEAWRMPLATTSGGPFGLLTSTPLIVGDTIYLQDMVSNVYSVDRRSGSMRWIHRDQALTVGPNGVAVGWGKVFAGIGDTGIIALDAADGREQWRFEPPLVHSEGIDIQPLAYGGRVFVATVPASLRGSGARSGYDGGSRGVLFALDADSGAVEWSFDTVDSRDFWGNPEQNGGGGAWYPPLIDGDRGMLYWGTGNPSPWPGLPEAPSGSSRPGPNLYTSSVVALGLGDGKLAWYHQERAHDLFDWDFQNPPIRVRRGEGRAARELILGSGKTGTVVALDPDDGSLVWRAKVGWHENDELESLPAEPSVVVAPGVLGGVLTPPAYADGVVYVPVVDMGTTFGGSDYLPDVGNIRGSIVALDVRDGREIWKAQLRSGPYGSVLVVNDLVIAPDGTGRVHAFARETGEQVWHFDAGGGINAPPVVAGDTLLVPVGMGQGALIALRLSGA